MISKPRLVRGFLLISKQNPLTYQSGKLTVQGTGFDKQTLFAMGGK